MTTESPSTPRMTWLAGKRHRLFIGGFVLILAVSLIGATQKRRILRWLHKPTNPVQTNTAPVPAFTVASLGQDERAQITSALARPWRAAWSLLDGVSIYQRAGHVEHYGTDFRERRSRPVAVDRSVFQVTADSAFLIWWPERNPALAEAELLEVAFAGNAPTHGTITVGLVLQSGEVHTFGYSLGPAAARDTELPFFPEDFSKAVRSPRAHGMARAGNRLHGRLPADVQTQLKQQGDQAVRCWFLSFDGLSETDVPIRHISLLAPAQPFGSAVEVTVAGAILGGTDAERVLSVVTESGKIMPQEITSEGKFTVHGLAAHEPVSVRVEYQAQEYYADAGRWFIPGANRNDLVIHVAPSYVNADQHKPNPKERLARSNKKTGYSEWYAPHARQVWNGDENLPQEYEGKSFSNNIGHLDRDRFRDNPDNCLRIVHLGSSHAVAGQVRLCDRYNLLMEPELAIRLGRPVEVISLGRNNGDLAANYPRIRDFASQLKPDVILLEHGSFLGMQLHPELLRRMHGYDPEHTHLDNFYYDSQGKLIYRPSCDDWPLHVHKPDLSDLTPGIPFYDTLRVPFAHMHPFGRESYKYVADIMRFYRQSFPAVRFMLHTGLDQAQARGQLTRTAKLAGGIEIPIGVKAFMTNMDEIAAKEGFTLLQPRLPIGFGDKEENYLTFIRDGHFAPRGHQWLAKELCALLHTALPSQDSLSGADLVGASMVDASRRLPLPDGRMSDEFDFTRANPGMNTNFRR